MSLTAENVEITLTEEFQKLSVGMLGLQYSILSIVSAFKFVKPFTSLRMQHSLQ